MPSSGRAALLALLTPRWQREPQMLSPVPAAEGAAGGGDFADVLPNCSRAQITASLLPYMYRSWHLGRGPGEPPPPRGMCTFSGISKGQGGESRWDSGGEPKMPYWSQGHWNRSSLEGISESSYL